MTNIFDSLNKEQSEAVRQIAGPTLILAGAGSGKTKVLTCRIAYLLEEQVAPYSILAITFTNKAAKEMRQRVDRLVGPNAKDVWLFTFHGFCSRILRREIDNLPGYSRSFSIYDPTDCKNILKEVLKKLNLDDKYYPYNMLISTISNAKNAMLDARLFAAQAADFHSKKVAEIYAEYEKKLVDSNALDFDDLLLLTIKLFSANQEVLTKYQQKFSYVLIDEYQDTNHVQYLLAKLLCAKHHNLCVVGDIDQSIYGWRGADITNILDFEKDYPEAKVVKLEQNYRSTQVILDAANAVINNNTARKPKNLWTDNKNGVPIMYYRARDDRDEADFAIREIRSMQDEGKKLGDMAVLYRTNAQSRIFEELLVKSGLPYIMVGGLKFYDRKEIKDILAYLRVLFNFQDNQGLLRIINVPRRGIGAATIEKLQALAETYNCSLFELITDPFKLANAGRIAGKLESFAQTMTALKNMVD
ncbi:MAG: UvrD-helicase domain-containing protein, partial [Acidaminococcaceae bacterium]